MSKNKLVKEMVAEVLAANDNGFLNTQDLAEQAFKEAYGPYTYKALEEKVRRSIYGAIGILSEQGLVVIGLKNEKLKGNVIDRWKVAGEGDEVETSNVLKQKIVRANGFLKACDAFTDNATEKKLLPDAELKRLT